MSLIGKPVPPALADHFVPLFAPDQETRFSNAMQAEASFGDVHHRVALGILEKPPPVFLAGAKE